MKIKGNGNFFGLLGIFGSIGGWFSCSGLLEGRTMRFGSAGNVGKSWFSFEGPFGVVLSKEDQKWNVHNSGIYGRHWTWYFTSWVKSVILKSISSYL